ncbi:MAG: CHAT domain-containing protein/Tfp pilus assembly protein PilF [Saprospiraceae bacterium]|jgi:CHAT domain-containing protein/Tfp pilus assembly protein PilF
MRLIIFCILSFLITNTLASQNASADPSGIQLGKEGDQLYNQGKFSLAIEKYNASTQIFEQEKNWDSYIKDKISIMECYFYLGKGDEVFKLMEPIKEQCALHLGDQHLLMGELFYLFAKIDNRFRKADQVFDLTSKALEIFKKTKGDNRRKIAGCYNTIAMNWSSKKDYDQALNYYDQALKIKIEALGKDDRSVGITLNNIGNVYYHLGNNGKAIEHYEKALRIKIKQLGDQHPRVSDTYFNIGNFYARDGNYDKAIVLFEKSIAIDRKNEEDQNRKLAHRLTSLSEAYFYKNKLDLALKYGHQAIAYYQKTEANPILSATAHQNLGTIHQRSKQYEKALLYYQEALHMLSPTDIKESSLSNPEIEKWIVSERLFQVLREKMFTLEAWNQAEPANYKLEAALNTAEAVIRTIIFVQQDIETENSKFLFLKDSRLYFEKALGYCLELFEITGDPIYKEKAVEIYEQSKAFLLRNILQNEQAQSLAAIPDSLKQGVDILKEELNEIVFQSNKTTEAEEKNTLQIALFEKNRTYQSKVIELEQNFPKYFQMKNELTEFNLSAIQQNIEKDQEAVFAWFVGEEQLFFFQITNTQIEVKRLKKDTTLETSIAAFARMLNNNALAGKKGNSKQLYLDFIQQSESIFQKIFPKEISIPASVVLIPDGILNLIPFEILLTEDSENLAEIDYSILPYLLKKASVRYAYAPSLLLVEPKKKETNQKGILAFAPTYAVADHSLLATRSGFSPLEFAQKEIQNLSQTFAIKSMVGSLATEENFKNLAHQYRFLHLAMHAFTDDETPSFSGLIFPKNAAEQKEEILYAYEIANMNLSTDLVVLSACNTGAGKQVAGEGPISLARSFRQAGCPNIVMSLWQADDETTSILMNSFYKNLKAGKGKAEALRLAKLSYLDQSRKNFPHYWAAFVLTGDNETINLGKRNPLWFVLGFGILFLVGFYIWKRNNAL